MRRGHGSQRVLHVVAAQKRGAHGAALSLDLQGEARAGGVQRRLRGPHVRRLVDRIGPEPAAGCVEPVPGAIGSVHDHPPARIDQLDQACLGGQIALEVPMVVQVVLREVREDGRVEVHPVQAVLLEGVRRGLHDHRAQPTVGELPQPRRELDRAGRRESLRSLPHAPVVEHAERSDRGGRQVGRDQMAHEHGRRRLSVRAGHADGPQRSTRISQNALRGERSCPPSVADDELGDRDVEPALDDRGHSAAPRGLLHEVVRVALAALPSEEEVSRAHRPRVLAHALDGDVLRADGLQEEAFGAQDAAHRSEQARRLSHPSYRDS